MTLPVGTKVIINPNCQYRYQGYLDGVAQVGVVIQNNKEKSWDRDRWGNIFDVKVNWPHKEYNVYNSDTHLIPISSNKQLKDFL